VFCLVVLPSAAFGLEVFYQVLGARVEMPQYKQDWIDYGTINATNQKPEVTKREVDKAVKRAFDDGAKRVKIQRQIFTSPTTAGKPEDVGEASLGKDLPESVYVLPGGDAGSSDKPQPPEQGKPKPEKWEMWLEEKKDGQWGEVPERRYPYTDYETFAKAFADYDKTITGLNQNGVRYRLKWRAAESQQPKPIETPEVKKVELNAIADPVIGVWQKQRTEPVPDGTFAYTYTYIFEFSADGSGIQRDRVMSPVTPEVESYKASFSWKRSDKGELLIRDEHSKGEWLRADGRIEGCKKVK